MERLDSNQYQGMVEDQDNTSNAPKAKKSIRITTTDNNLERLVEITKLMSKEMRGALTKCMGGYWTYWISLGRYVDERKIAKLIGLHPDQLKFEKRGEIQGLRKSFLEDHLEALAGRGSWHYFDKTLALTIYGLILFPFAPNMVDHAAMDVFAQYETQGLNPVPAILADTLLTLEVCQKKNGGTLKCCTHLLYVWIITHMYACELQTLFPDPLRDFGRIQVKRREAREWKKELADIQDNKIAWTCPWYSPYEVIFGDFANVSLMGPRGCVAYTPSIALRQLKRTQVKPMEEQLGGICFQYDVPYASQLLDRVRAAWKSVQRKRDDELGKP
ncbi:hypothetical protein SESBI_47883 [Sesbania bispinosa]|nr:hypothetical protein SESBI_47883 [Sesbania bispinosa]